MTWTSSQLHAIQTRRIEAIAEALGNRRDTTDRARFKRTGSIISINGQRFYDHLSGTGGSGAIDLVMHT